MKYSDLPYICINGGEIVDDEARAWPGLPDPDKPGLRKQASVSCQELTWVEEEEEDMSSASSSPYVNVPPVRRQPPAEPSTSHEATEYINLPAGTRTSRFRSLDKDRVNSVVSPSQGMTAVVFRELAEQKKKGIPSKVFEAIFDYVPKYKDELPLKAGDIVTLTLRETGEQGWFYGKRNTGEFGFFPETYVKHIGDEAVEIKASEIDAPSGAALEDCEIGRGGYANVYRVRYKDMNVALKLMRSTSANFCAKQIEALKHEAVMIKRLKHPNIVGVYGICLEKPYFGLLLELCEGQSLKSVLRLPSAAEEIDLRTISIFASQIADAMAFLAQHNCVHRDLKSENVLVKEVPCKCDYDSPGGSQLGIRTIDQDTGICSRCKKNGFSRLTLKVTDFGVTKQLDSEEEAKRNSVRIVGTEAWLAPEAYKRQQYSEASDVWSFGVVLWEMLTKKEPFEEHSQFIAFRVASQTLKLDVINPPKRYNELMQSCWDRDPLKRPTFSKLLADFRQYQTSLDEEQINNEENRNMRAMESKVNALCSHIRNDGKGEEIIALYEQLYATLDIANLVLDQAETNDLKGKVPKHQPPRKNAKKHFSKNDIGKPSDLRKGVSVQMEQGPGKSFNIIVGDSSTNKDFPVFSDTLPRREKDRLATPPKNLQSPFSKSSPNLDQIENGKGTLTRQHAIKKRKRNTILPPDEELATVQLADDEEDVPDIAAESRRVPQPTISSPGSVSSSSSRMRSESHSTNRFTRWFKGNKKNTSVDDEEVNSTRSSMSSNSSKIPPAGHFGRSPMSPFSLDRPTNRPNRSMSNTSGLVSEDEGVMSPSRVRNKISPVTEKIRKPIVQATNTYSPYSPVSQFAQPHGPIGLDDPIPSPSENGHGGDFHHPPLPSHRRTSSDHRRTSSDDRPPYEILRGPVPIPPPMMTPPSHFAPGHPSSSKPCPKLNTVVPLPSLLSRQVDDRDDDPYIDCGSASIPPAATNNGPAKSLTNSPYVQLPSTRPSQSSLTSLQNDQYFHCSAKPERPDSLPLRRAHTPESSGISTGGSSAFSTMSSLTDAPTTLAPQPPNRMPPAIPPREGIVGLPVQSAS